MKYLITRFIIFLSVPCYAGLSNGFDKQEAKDMIAICNSFTFLELYDDDKEIIPAGFEKIYTSEVMGMDNKFQVYKKGDIAVINLRGSTDQQISWVENMYSSMIPAKGIIKIDGQKFLYCFAKSKNAAVHSGYALAIAFMHKELLQQIKGLNKEGITSIIITGHSQGGALANMLKAYLENITPGKIPYETKYKTYAFAAPMTGNKEFAAEYNHRFGSDSSSFNIANPEDIIPTFPLNYNDTNRLKDYLKSFLFDRESFSLKKMITDGSVRFFEGSISSLNKYLGKSSLKKINKDLGQVEMPPAVNDINFFPLDERIEIGDFEYPKVLKDSSILRNDSLMALYQKDKEGNFVNTDLYKKPSWTYEHKPYNYFVAILKKYFPEDYRKLQKKYLIENL